MNKDDIKAGAVTAYTWAKAHPIVSVGLTMFVAGLIFGLMR